MATKITKTDIKNAKLYLGGLISIPDVAKKMKRSPSQAAYHMLRALREDNLQKDYD